MQGGPLGRRSLGQGQAAVRVPILHLADPGIEAWREGTRGPGQDGEWVEM